MNPLCSAKTKQGEPCKMRRLDGEATCLSHSERGVEQRRRATQASAEARRERRERLETASLEDSLTLTQRIRREAAKNAEALARSLVEAAKSDGSSAAMRELLNRTEGKVIDRIEAVPTDPFQMDEAQLTRWLYPDGTPAEGES